MGMALCTIGLSLRYRTPVVVAWSTPGAALLTTVGITGWFDSLMKRVPSSIAAALLAGILFEIGIEIFHAAEHQTALVVVMFFVYLLGKCCVPRYAIPATLIAGIVMAGGLGLLDFSRFHV